ncbi:MAG: hypothetical protein GY882_03935 [Actinomycetia bacterium]|nr:hypothetical protein [Actinomycetes bacterium]MCP4843680.1 hypothetical protein [Actinomycetes bacterium]
MIPIGTRVKVIGQNITGTLVRVTKNGTHEGKAVILDDDRDMWRFDTEPAGEEGTLIYSFSELEVIA